MVQVAWSMDRTISHKHRLTIQFKDLPLKEIMHPRMMLFNRIQKVQGVIKLKMAKMPNSVKELWEVSYHKYNLFNKYILLDIDGQIDSQMKVAQYIEQHEDISGHGTIADIYR